MKYKPGDKVYLISRNYNGSVYNRPRVLVTIKQYNPKTKMYWVIDPKGFIKKMVKEQNLSEEKE